MKAQQPGIPLFDICTICWPQLKLTGTTYTLTLSPTPTWHDGLHFWPVGMLCLSNGGHSFNIQWFQMSWVSVVMEPTAIGNGFSSVVWLQRTGRISNGERADTNRNSGCSVGQTLDRPYSPVQMRQRIGSRNRLYDFFRKPRVCNLGYAESLRSIGSCSVPSIGPCPPGDFSSALF